MSIQKNLDEAECLKNLNDIAQCLAFAAEAKIEKSPEFISGVLTLTAVAAIIYTVSCEHGYKAAEALGAVVGATLMGVAISIGVTEAELQARVSKLIMDIIHGSATSPASVVAGVSKTLH